ncbi:MAG: clan AA aspartic protease [Planctomycetes bacterium]|nr:clan AA aspartic protease [Planctomycetota bacterium]
MITGIVTPSLAAVVRLHIEDANGQTQAIDVKIDTGFSDFICLPLATVAALGLVLTTHEIVEIADGSFVRVPVFSGVVIWDGKPRRIDVHALGKQNLIGMAMLAGHDLAIRVQDGGAVSIHRVP